jgi:hypothetical protein
MRRQRLRVAAGPLPLLQAPVDVLLRLLLLIPRQLLSRRRLLLCRLLLLLLELPLLQWLLLSLLLLALFSKLPTRDDKVQSQGTQVCR